MLTMLHHTLPKNLLKEIKNNLDKYKAIPSSIEAEGETSLLKTTDYNFLIEGIHFYMKLDGTIVFKEIEI